MGRTPKFDKNKIIKLIEEHRDTQKIRNILSSSLPEYENIRFNIGIYEPMTISSSTITKFAAEAGIKLDTKWGRPRGKYEQYKTKSQTKQNISREKAAEFIRAVNKKNLNTKKEMFNYFCDELNLAPGEVLEFARLCEVV